MTDLNNRAETSVESGMGRNLERLDQDLDIMERHEAAMAEVEGEIQESMRRWDREYKDARLHSVPRSRKHMR
ncbi:MAG: hypothetical protein C0617_03045 [Desulfuromonas sp.]|uniref:hypothetical protein n=1 Tax=Desulfuromonas sp. TaxID=892 RepID=UPI000CCA31B5|nr:hypothetical protein [Desulfuromonas sp.]PLX85675.1 MAG: hypothetical protein C0617_03045 [Desulfuromonas sp.]